MNNNVIYFKIPGEPKGKGRPRAARRGRYISVYTPKGTKDQESLISQCYRESVPDGFYFACGVPIEVSIICNFPVRDSWTKRKRAAALHQTILPTVKPDVDNICKIVLDALNGEAYHDDKQIVSLQVIKRYAAESCVEVMIGEYEGEKAGGLTYDKG